MSRMLGEIPAMHSSDTLKEGADMLAQQNKSPEAACGGPVDIDGMIQVT